MQTSASSSFTVFERFVRAIQPFLFSLRYPNLTVSIDSKTRQLLDDIRTKPAVICPNHCRHEDGELLYLISIKVNQRFQFLAAHEMFRSYFGFGGVVLKALGCLEVDRGGENFDSVRTAEDSLAEGANKVVIFPEGEIDYDNDMVEALEPGAAAIALDAQRRLSDETAVMVVPLALSYQFDDPEHVCASILSRLEHHFRLTSHPVSLVERAGEVCIALLQEKAARYGVVEMHSTDLDAQVHTVTKAAVERMAASLNCAVPHGNQLHQVHYIQSKIYAQRKKADIFSKHKFSSFERETLELIRLRCIKAEKLHEAVSLHTLADLLTNLAVLASEKYAVNKRQTVHVSASSPINARAYISSSGERTVQIDNLTETLHTQLQADLRDMRAASSKITA